MAKVDEYQPMLLDERPLALDEPGWIYELKMDGYRLLAEFDGTVQLRTRNGTDATTWFPEITHSLAKLKYGLCVVDGEVCVLDEIGRSDFNQLQDRARRRGRYPGAAPTRPAAIKPGLSLTGYARVCLTHTSDASFQRRWIFH